MAAVANADPNDLLPVLLQAQASKVRFGDDRNEANFREKLLEKARIITESANRIWRTYTFCSCLVFSSFYLMG